MRIVCVEGNIGAGKSTLLRKLDEMLGDDWKVILEPADTDPVFAKLLQDFTESKQGINQRVALQRYITEQRANMLKDLPDGNYIVERSLFSDLVFLSQGMLELALTAPQDLPANMGLYSFVFEKLEDYPQIDTCIYLRTSPIKAYQRMMRRGRQAERGTPVDYLKDVSNYHDAVLTQLCRLTKTDMIVLNGDAPTHIVAAHIMQNL